MCAGGQAVRYMHLQIPLKATYLLGNTRYEVTFEGFTAETQFPIDVNMLYELCSMLGMLLSYTAWFTHNAEELGYACFNGYVPLHSCTSPACPLSVA